MEVLNDTTNPPIKVVSKVTRSLNHWSKNIFVDPSDNVPFFTEDLTSEELGHIYKWKVTVGQWILVHMPYKIMDSATGKLVKGLRSYKSCSPYINGSLPERHLKNPKSCIRDFRLSREDFSTFSRRVTSLNGSLIKDEVDVSLLSSRVVGFRKSIADTTKEIHQFRDRVCLVSGTEYYTSQEDLTNVLQTFHSYRQKMSDISSESVSIVLELDKLSKETDRDTDKVRINAEFESVRTLYQEFRRIPIERYEREAIHKSRVDLGEESESKPLFIRGLQQEINELKAYYPCLSRLRVVDDGEVAIDLTGIDITFTNSSVIVRGDPGALKAYMAENSTSDGEVGSRRSRNIIGSGKSKK